MKTTTHSDIGHDASDNEHGEMKMTRRELLRQAGIAGVLLALPWGGKLVALPQPIPKPPRIAYTPSKRGDGVIGPFGEVLVFKVGTELLPAYVEATGGLAVMDLTERTPYVRYGSGSSAITLTSAGVQFGSVKPVKWSADTVKQLVSMLAKDRKLANSVLMLRSALFSAYPVAAAQSKEAVQKKDRKGTTKSGSAMSSGILGYGSRVMNCTTQTVTDTVTRTITESVEVIKTAEKQYQECYDKQVNKSPCKDLPIGKGACAAAICAVTTFVDMVVGFIEVVTTITEEVTREVVTCVTPRRGEWPNPWAIIGAPANAALPQPQASFGAKEIEGAQKFLKEIGGFLGPFGKCLVNGTWSLAQLETPIDLGGGNIALPYGVKVCIDATCAEQLSADQILGELAASWGAALGALAALSPAFAAEVASLGIVATPAIAALVASVPPAIVAAAAILLAFIILGLIYGTAISGQLFIQRHFTDNFADGTVCIEHPTFALGLIKLATLGFAPAELIPPVVTG